MTPEHNEFVLSTAYHSGWINLDQYHAPAGLPGRYFMNGMGSV